MSKFCEITGKKASSTSDKKKSVRSDLLKRKIQIPEHKTSVRLRVSKEGLEVLKKVGGLINFIKEKGDKKLSPKLAGLKSKYGIQKKEANIEAKVEEKPAS